MNELALITGGTGTGKSTLSKELIKGVATGSQFRGCSVVVADLKMSKFTDTEELPINTEVVNGVDAAFELIEKYCRVNKPLIVCIGEVDMILYDTHRFLNMMTKLCLREQPTFLVYIGSRFSKDTFPQSVIKVATDIYVTRYPDETISTSENNFDYIEQLRYPDA